MHVANAFHQNLRWDDLFDVLAAQVFRTQAEGMAKARLTETIERSDESTTRATGSDAIISW